MDAIRATLKSHGISRCVAFVVGRTALGHEDALQRWLDDGYELGNHTFDHPRASQVSVDRFVASIERCHEVLESVRAFANGRPRWFRFPYLSRGFNASARADIQTRCEALGYRVAHASVDFYDDHFEKRFGDAIRRGDRTEAAAIGRRYEEVALESLYFAASRMRETLGRGAPLVPYCHFGALSSQHLGRILRRLQSAKMEICSLEEALADQVYVNFDADRLRDGLVIHSLPRSPVTKFTSGLARLSELVDVASQARYGPRWPYLR